MLGRKLAMSGGGGACPVVLNRGWTNIAFRPPLCGQPSSQQATRGQVWNQLVICPLLAYHWSCSLVPLIFRIAGQVV